MDPEAFINIKCQSAFCNLQNISQVQKCLTTMSVKTIMQDCVPSKLNYFNYSLLWSPISLALSFAESAEICCMYHQQCEETGLYVTHSGCAALAANQTAHWLQNSPVHLQSAEWSGPAYLADLLIPYKLRKNLRSSSKHYLDALCTFCIPTAHQHASSTKAMEWTIIVVVVVVITIIINTQHVSLL